jgi:hypothetical protein
MEYVRTRRLCAGVTTRKQLPIHFKANSNHPESLAAEIANFRAQFSTLHYIIQSRSWTLIAELQLKELVAFMEQGLTRPQLQHRSRLGSTS